MAELEYKGIKIGGSKLLLLFPLIGTVLVAYGEALKFTKTI